MMVRGIAFVDALARDVLYACRTFRRAPLAALTIVGTVALGLGLVAVVFTIYNMMFLRVDAVRNPHELFEIRRPPSPSERNTWVPFTRPQHEALRRETTAFADTAAMLGGNPVRVDGRMMRCTLVSSNFFQMLGVSASLGRTLMPADDMRSAAQAVLVLSHRGWARLFDGDPAVIGRRVPVNGVPYEIAGVMPREFRGLGIGPPDCWAALAGVGQFRPASAGREDEITIEIVGRLRPGLSPEAATDEMSAWASASSDLKAVNDRPKTIMLRPRQGTIHADLIEELLVFTPIFFAFGLILMIGCANVTNLLLARGISRQREIGIRLSLGASRAGIIRLLLTESLLLALGSASCALVVSRLALSSGLNAVSTTMPAEVAEQISLSAPAWDWRVIAFLLCGATVSTVLLGLAPALQAARLELVRTMRGEITHDARPGRARNALIAVQVGASALLLICAAVFLRSALAAAAVEPGLRVDDTLALEIGNESARAAVLQEVTGDPTVAAVAAAWPSMLGGTLGVASVSGANTSSRLPIDYKFVSPEYFSLLDIDVVRGRGFAPAERTSGSGVAVVSETVARRLWPDRDAVGQTLHLEPATPRPGEGVVDGPGRAGPAGPLLHARAFAVVGVVRDARVGVGLFQIGDAGLYLPIDRESPETSLTLRVRGDPEHARQRLIERLARLDPAVSIRTLRTLVGIGAYILSIVFWVTAVLGALALALTLSGIFSVLSYVVEQRRQEIGVRMALGATTRSVMGLVLSQSARPVALGLLAGAGLAGTMAIALMSTPAASQIGDTVRVFDPLAYGASLLCIVTACLLAASIPALRAARIDPMATLRQE